MKHSDITTVRLPTDLNERLDAYSSAWNTTKSDVVKEALSMYFAKEEAEKDSWEVGESYFGKYGSGDGDLSVTYKKRLKEKLNVKYPR
jgi:hypothetical protein